MSKVKFFIIALFSFCVYVVVGWFVFPELENGTIDVPGWYMMLSLPFSVGISLMMLFLKKCINRATDYFDPLGERKHISDEKVDALYGKAVAIVLETNNASMSMLQRKLDISFDNAKQLISRMEQDGIVGPLCGTVPRKILVSRNKMHATYPSHQNDVSRIVEPKINIEQIVQEENEWRRQQRGLSPVEAELEQIDQMEGHQFEYWCADLLKKIGFINVEVTQGSGDQGVDILAVKDGIKYAIQCKCYSSDLGNKPIQEINTGKMIYHCQIGVVMTNRHFTAGGKEAAEATGVLLWDRDWIYAKLESISTQEGVHP